MSNPLDEYCMKKEAFGLNPKLRDAAGSAAVQFGVTAGLMAVPPLAQKIMNAVTKRRSYNQMLDQNPHLRSVREENPTQFNNFYNSLHRLNPSFASDPTVAGAYMGKMMAYPENAGLTVVESLKGAPSAPSFGEAWRSGAQTGSKALSSGMKSDGDPFSEQSQRIRGMELQNKERKLTRESQKMDEEDKQLQLYRR